MIGSAITWFIANAALFDYITSVLHVELGFGEPVWAIDPLGFMIISVPTGVVFLVGLLAVFDNILPKE
jgi:hypothetical protein